LVVGGFGLIGFLFVTFAGARNKNPGRSCPLLF